MEGLSLVDAGCGGTRHVLAAEGYRWIAPLSAFYEEAVQPVDVSGWYPSLPPGILIASKRPGSNWKLRPDYIGLRPLKSGPPEWAVVESKGTDRSINNLSSCPTEWKQAGEEHRAESKCEPCPYPQASGHSNSRQPERKTSWQPTHSIASLELSRGISIVDLTARSRAGNRRCPSVWFVP